MANKYRIGVDLGGTNIKVGVVDEHYNLLGKKSGKTDPYNRPWQEVVADMARLSREIVEEGGLSLADCTGLGMGSPGMIDHDRGVVAFAANFSWEEVPLVKGMQEHFDLPIKLANDANCAVYGEALAGAAKGARDVVMLTLGTGVGGGVVAGGHLQHGGSAGGMELGHMVMVKDGEWCTCGQHGCVEAYASATAIIRNAKRAAEKDKSSVLWELCEGNLDNMNGRIPFIAARRGDAGAAAVVQEYVECVGVAVVNCINIWRPEKVLLGGGIANEGEPLLGPVNDYVQSNTFAGKYGFIAPVLNAALGNDAGLIGAAAL